VKTQETQKIDTLSKLFRKNDGSPFVLDCVIPATARATIYNDNDPQRYQAACYVATTSPDMRIDKGICLFIF
jgi:hypothetical protein